LPLIILAALAVVLTLYYRNRENEEIGSSRLKLLMVLRFLSFFLTGVLLLSPFIRSQKKIIRPPLIVTAWDNSASVISAGDSLELTDRINNLKETVTRQLQKEYKTISYSFGQETEILKTLNFTGKKSDYSNLISTILNNHYNENIGALILAGDGLYNKGLNPLNMLHDVNFPFYTIGLGDTTEVIDALIQNVRVNRTAFSGNSFPVEINTKFRKLKGRPLKLSIKQGGDILAEKVITPPDNDFFRSDEFILDAGAAGLKHFTANIEILKNERNIKNNRSEFVVNVLKNKQKILIISDGPHPDIGAVKNTLEQQQSFEVSVFTEEPYPSNIHEFNLIIMNQLPTPAKSMANLITESKNLRVPVLFIIGNKTFLPQMNTIAEGIDINPLAGSREEAQAVVNSSFATFNLSEDLKSLIPGLPPLQVPFANYRIDPRFDILLYQKLNNIETQKPLLATGIMKGKKTGIIFGEGIWKWRIYNYYLNRSHKEFNELITQLVQFLALRENEDNFMIDYKSVYDEIEDVIMTAEVYNEAFEKISNAEITILIKNEKSEEFNFTFDVSEEEYLLNAGNLPVGNYIFNAEVTAGQETFSEEGRFTITAVNIENIITRANHRILYQLAVRSGGDFLFPEQAEEIDKRLADSKSLQSVTYLQSMIDELLNIRWLFFVLSTLLGVEWFLRKYWGLY
jgi:hypothetical protein